jgi:protoporphyrinogen oxidase
MVNSNLNSDPTTVVIGAGPAGIGVGLALKERAFVVDSSNQVGGICRSIELDGAIFDLGGHSFHTPHPEVRDLVFDALEMYEQKREARCYSFGKIIDYPFQRSYSQLMLPEIVQECEEGLSEVQDAKGASHFEEFIQRKFGRGIAKHFMLPYNQKLWGSDLTRLAADWVGERVASAKDSQEKFDQSGGKRKPLQSNTSVAYPAAGGFGRIMDVLGSRLHHVRLNTSVMGVDPILRTLQLSSGESLKWGQLVSTMPVTQLLKLLPNVPASLIDDANRLEVLSLAVVLVVIGHPVNTPIQRVYCADADIPAHKIAVNHNSSPYLRSLPHHGIMAEISRWPEKPLFNDLEKQTVDGLLKLQLIQSRDEVRMTKLIEVPYGYPVPTHDRDAIITRLKTWLEKHGIFTIGRFGEWAYVNSDEALHRGLKLGQSLA